MCARLSVDEVLANLEKRVAFHEEREAFHAQREVHHREQRAVHAAELAKVRQSLEAFRAVAPEAVSLAQPLPSEALVPENPAPSATAEIELPPPGKKMVSGLIALAVKDLPEPFGPVEVAALVSRRFADRLEKPVERPAASDILRRLLREGKLQLVREGTAHHQALYKRKPRRTGS